MPKTLRDMKLTRNPPDTFEAAGFTFTRRPQTSVFEHESTLADGRLDLSADVTQLMPDQPPYNRLPPFSWIVILGDDYEASGEAFTLEAAIMELADHLTDVRAIVETALRYATGPRVVQSEPEPAGPQEGRP